MNLITKFLDHFRHIRYLLQRLIFFWFLLNFFLIFFLLGSELLLFLLFLGTAESLQEGVDTVRHCMWLAADDEYLHDDIEQLGD